MRKALFLASIVAALAGPLAAHHGDTNYELDKPFTITGVVTQFRFGNPHVQITFEVTDAQGRVATWMAQGTSPNMLVHRGWSNVTLKPGDTITITGNRARNGSNTMKMNDLFMDGKDLNH